MKRSSHPAVFFLTLGFLIAGCSTKPGNDNTTAAGSSTPANTASPKPKPKRPNPDFTVTAEDLFKEVNAYKGLEATDKYSLKQIVVSGQVRTIAIGKNPMLVFLAAGKITEYVTCDFDEEEKDSVVALKEGQKVTLHCMGARMWATRPHLEHCTILGVE